MHRFKSIIFMYIKIILHKLVVLSVVLISARSPLIPLSTFQHDRRDILVATVQSERHDTIFITTRLHALIFIVAVSSSTATTCPFPTYLNLSPLVIPQQFSLLNFLIPFPLPYALIL